MRRSFWSTVLFATLALVVLSAPAGGGSASVEKTAADPIEGTWQWSGGEILVVARGGGTFIGTVVRAPVECGHPVGQEIWRMSGGAGTYTGLHTGRHRTDCTPFPALAATWVVSGTAMRFCYYDPEVGQQICANPARIRGPAPTPATGPSNALDIEIAIDTTGSMGSSITQAKADAHRLVLDVRKRFPGARFAVVQFRDRADTPEYAVVQTFTANAALVDAAVDTLAPGGGGDTPEAYNLVFRNTLAPALGWYVNSRKVLVVIGDAEPHGAKTAGFSSCRDTSSDPQGLNTATELAALRGAKWTVLMILQRSTASTSIECYAQLAAAGYKGGAARLSGDANLIAVVEALIEKAVATTDTKTPAAKDTIAPSVRAFPASGKVFETVALRYRVSDNSGTTREQVMIYRGTAVLLNATTNWGTAKAGRTYHVNWVAKARPGTLKWCLRSFDKAGNRSAKSCAALRLTK